MDAATLNVSVFPSLSEALDSLAGMRFEAQIEPPDISL